LIFDVGSKEYGIICTTCDGRILFLNLFGKVIFEYKLDGEIFSSPIFFDSKLTFGCRDNYFYTFKIVSKELE
jgi:outer membrane protein assembly factor BamB